jgi:DNA-binding NtrC family response regulator
MSEIGGGGFIMNEKNALVFIVDDDRHTRESLRNLIRSAGLSAQTFSSAQEFLAAERPKAPGCLVLDVQLPGLSGLDLQQELAKAGVKIPIIFITGYGDIPTSVRAIKAGALEFLTKPVNREDLLHAIHQAIARDHTARQPNGDTGTHNFEEIVGTSAALTAALKQVEVVAPTESTVLILGETGTGKELIARAIHAASSRSRRPFVKLNCAAIPTGLLESELFGHEKGAFTGAIAQRIGRFELADGGTVFLDEVGDIPLELQTKLLRVLQEREFERLGSARTLRTDARLIAATNRELRKMVEQQKFREDLFYRLNVFPIYVPALRERSEDIPLLVNHFAQRFARRMNRTIETIPAETMAALTRYSWPGNIRELQNLIERAVILSHGPVLQIPLQDLDNRIALRRDNGTDQTLEESQRAHILAILNETRWVLAGPRGAAARLGMNRSTLQFRLKKLGIVRPDICASLD